jgi:hypothetical protein
MEMMAFAWVPRFAWRGQHDFARLSTIPDDLPAKRHEVSTIFHDMGAKADDLPAKSHARHGALARRWR